MADLKQLFLGWLYGMYEDERKIALARSSHSRTGTVYKRAHEELSKYPLAIYAPREMLVVRGIGPGIVKMLEARLEEHNRTNHKSDITTNAIEVVDITIPTQPAKPPKQRKTAKQQSQQIEQDLPENLPCSSSKKRKVEYVPKYRSGAWAILLTLQELGVYLTKAEIIKRSLPHADTPLDAPATNGSFYNGWSSMATLLEKELVTKYSHPPRFTLTEEGAALVTRMIASSTQSQAKSWKESSEDESSEDESFVMFMPDRCNLNIPSHSLNSQISTKPNCTTTVESIATILKSSSSVSSNNIIQLNSNSSSFCESESVAPASPSPAMNTAISKDAILLAGSFEVVLLLDNREVKNGYNRNFFKDGLSEKGIRFESRSLEIGDITWIARPKGYDAKTHGEEKEILLEYIIERKTMDDLVASIKDGRFKEQKFRLSDCGISNVIYLIEEVNLEAAEIFGMEGNFYQGKTIAFNRERALENRQPFSKPPKNSLTYMIYSISFPEYTRRNSKTKNFSLGDVWIRQLMTIPGISAEKACFFVKTFNTSASLFNALLSCENDSEREKTIQKAGGEGRKQISLILAKKLLAVFWKSETSATLFTTKE
ncbi:Crossover junction endonuclease mus81 [Physocladia obscura]|uniref:Crossover junction endonuclease MUS81 n=1 Tax=Physocladia obscura TaxID=109957 RepID=A0AAD5XH02_9FUNG|nr:Crossover junction endonuclease mus81 [Physocladia obscura]